MKFRFKLHRNRRVHAGLGRLTFRTLLCAGRSIASGWSRRCLPVSQAAVLSQHTSRIQPEGTAVEMNRPMSLSLCFATAMIEGIDLQSMGLAAPRLGPEFHLSQSQMGLVLSATSLGLLLGAFIGGRLADRFGRKAALITSIVTFGLFQLATTQVHLPGELLVARLCCGLGLGGAMPNLIALASEMAAGGSGLLEVVIISAGMPGGGALASAIVYFAGEAFDWRLVFYVGGCLPLIMAPLLAWLLPESAGFRALQALTPGKIAKTGTLAALFGGGRARASLWLWAACFGTNIILYILINWLPLLMASKGFSKSQAALVQLPFTLGSATGSVLLGWLMIQRTGRRILPLCYVGVMISLLILARIHADLGLALAAAALVGSSITGAQFILYGLSQTYYHTAIRGTGTGAAIASGRLGSIVGPMLAGLLLNSGNGSGFVLVALLPVAVFAALSAVFLLRCRPAEEPRTFTDGATIASDA
jgi:AAHS family 3-hydroxyphenylpropionic acid transporter